MSVATGEARRAGRAPASPSGKVRLVILVSHPIQYFAPVFRALARRPEIALSVVYHCRMGLEKSFDEGFGGDVRWDIPLVEGYDHRFLSSTTRLGGVRPAIVGALRELRPDVLMVHGYASATNLLAIFAGKSIGAKLLMRGDTRVQPGAQRRRFTSAVKRALFKAIDGFVSVGSGNAGYYRSLGVPDEKIFFAPFCVDNRAFQLDRPRREAERRAARAELGLPAQSVVLCFAGKLAERKCPRDLLDAYAGVAATHPQVRLVFIGSGMEEANLRRTAESLAMPDVVFAGFRNQSELPRYLAASDIFVLPARDEPWGLAVNEAMAAGLPVVVSDEVGAAADLVAGKGTGAVFRCGSVEELTRAIETLVESPELRTAMSARARQVIAEWDVENCVDGIVRASALVCGRAR